MNKLNNQRKITHRAQKNPIKSDLITENTHRDISGTVENESDLKQINHVTDNTDITQNVALVSMVTLFIYGTPSVTKVFKNKYRLYHRVWDVLPC